MSQTYEIQGSNDLTAVIQSPTTQTFEIVGGLTGPAGQGVPAGGSTGQVLAKASSASYDTTWIPVPNAADFVDLTSDQSINGRKTFNDPIGIQLQDSTPGIPIVDSNGAFYIKGGDGTVHFKIFPTLDADDDYDADIWSKDNMYIVAENFVDIRSGYDSGLDEYVGRIRFKALVDPTSGVGTNYIQNGRRFSGDPPHNNWAFTDYNSSFAWMYFAQDQNGYAYFGNKFDSGTGLYATPLARIHAYDGAATVALFQSFNASGTGRIGLMDINTTSGSAVTIGAFGDKQILRAESTNYARGNAVGLYAGGNADATAHIHAAPSNTSAAALRIPTGVAPTSPNDGDVWNDGSNLYFRLGSTTYTLSFDSLVAHLAGTETFTGKKTFAPTNATDAFVVSNSGGTTHMLRVDSTNGRVGVNLGSATGLNSTLAVNGNSVLGGGATTATARADIQAATTGFESFRFRSSSGVAPSSPNDGGGWYDGTDIQFRYGSTTSALASTSTSQTLSNKTLTTPKVTAYDSINVGSNKVVELGQYSASAVNYVGLENAPTGSGVTIYSAGTDTNIDLMLNPKGSGTVDAGTSRVTRVVDPTSAQDAATKNYVDAQVTAATPDATTLVKGKVQLAGDLGGTAASPTVLTVGGNTISTTNTAQTLTGQKTFPTGATSPRIGQINDSNGNTSLTFTATASAVNYPTFTNSATGTTVSQSVAGTDTNIDLTVSTKGTGKYTYMPGSNSATAFRVMNAAGSTTHIGVDTTNNRTLIGGGASSANSVLQVNGAISAPITTVTGATTLTQSNGTVLGDATSGAFNVTLPTAVGITGRMYTVKKIDSSGNAVTIATTSSQTIDGVTTKAISTQYTSYTVQSDGANWMII